MAPTEMLKKREDLRQFQYLEMSNCFPCRQDATCGIAYTGKISGSIWSARMTDEAMADRQINDEDDNNDDCQDN